MEGVWGSETLSSATKAHDLEERYMYVPCIPLSTLIETIYEHTFEKFYNYTGLLDIILVLSRLETLG